MGADGIVRDVVRGITEARQVRDDNAVFGAERVGQTSEVVAVTGTAVDQDDGRSAGGSVGRVVGVRKADLFCSDAIARDFRELDCCFVRGRLPFVWRDEALNVGNDEEDEIQGEQQEEQSLPEDFFWSHGAGWQQVVSCKTHI